MDDGVGGDGGAVKIAFWVGDTAVLDLEGETFAVCEAELVACCCGDRLCVVNVILSVTPSLYTTT